MIPSFSQAFQIVAGDVVSIVGAGGKTSLMFRLAGEAAERGLKTLVTTTTRLFIPRPDQYDAIDLSGAAFERETIDRPGVYVAGVPDRQRGKMAGLCEERIATCLGRFDLLLIEADGSARKPLKGWKETEPVIDPRTTRTIGVVDIQTVGRIVSDDLVHRLDIFLDLTGAVAGRPVALNHLKSVVTHHRGLFGRARGERLLFVNKVESSEQRALAQSLGQLCPKVRTVAGSVRQGVLYD